MASTSDPQAPGVLIVDDQAEIRSLLQTVLRHYGFNVWIAPGGWEALLLYRQIQDRVNLVLLDVDMPEWDGPKTLKALQGANPAVVCCFVVGQQTKPTEAALLKLGAIRVVRKPFEPAELAQTLLGLVGSGIGDRRAGRRAERQETRVTVGAGLEPSYVVESWVSDQSPDGLRLHLPEKLAEVGALLSIRPVEGGEETSWVPVQVRHCRREGDGWVVGCMFLYPATDRPPQFAS